MAPFKCSADSGDRCRKWKNFMNSFKCSAEGNRCRKFKDWPHKSSSLGSNCLVISGWFLLSIAGEITVLRIWRALKHTRDIRTAIFESKISNRKRDKWDVDSAKWDVDDVASDEVDGVAAEVDGGKAELDGGKAEVDGGKAEVDGGKAEVDGGNADVDGVESDVERDKSQSLDRLPSEIKGRVFQHLPYELQIYQLQTVSKDFKQHLAESEEFRSLSPGEEPSLTACYFFIENAVWQWAGFDPSLKKWRRLPPLTNFLPANCQPDPDLFKEFLVCATDGLVCINFSKSPDKERLIVFNTLSGSWRELPPLIHRRNPVLMHMVVDSVTQAYQMIVAGSCRAGDEHLSKTTEVFNSSTGQWERTGDLPGPVFALNEYQSGVYQNGKLFCIGFVEAHDQVGKGILAYSVEEGRWLPEWSHPLSFCTLSSTILQLVESNGEVYLFSERENDRITEHWVDRLEWTEGNGDGQQNTCQLINVVKIKKTGGRSLEVYPEYACIPYSEGHLCILNAIDHTGVVYDIRDQGQSEFPLEALPEEGFTGELGFFSLNPMSFAVEPRFSSKV